MIEMMWFGGIWKRVYIYKNTLKRVLWSDKCPKFFKFLWVFLICTVQLTQYTHSLPIRNGVKSWWVRFLYFPDFWMVFVSYFPNFLLSPFLKFFIYFYNNIFITIFKEIFTHYYNIAIVWFECIFLNYQPFGIFLDILVAMLFIS